MKWLWYLLLLGASLFAGGLMIEALTGEPVIAGLSFGDAIDNVGSFVGAFFRFLGL